MSLVERLCTQNMQSCCLNLWPLLLVLCYCKSFGTACCLWHSSLSVSNQLVVLQTFAFLISLFYWGIVDEHNFMNEGILFLQGIANVQSRTVDTRLHVRSGNFSAVSLLMAFVPLPVMLELSAKGIFATSFDPSCFPLTCRSDTFFWIDFFPYAFNS